MNAGVTHPREAWLDALCVGGRLLLPLTVQMQATIGKGYMMARSRRDAHDESASCWLHGGGWCFSGA